MDAELRRLPGAQRRMRELCGVLDTLPLARQLHPGQRNSLDALCKRYSVDNSRRELHGALLDAGILVDVYLAMTGGQSALALDSGTRAGEGRVEGPAGVQRAPGIALAIPAPSAEEMCQHEALLDVIQKASGGNVVWRTVMPSPASDSEGTHKNH